MMSIVIVPSHGVLLRTIKLLLDMLTGPGGLTSAPAGVVSRHRWRCSCLDGRCSPMLAPADRSKEVGDEIHAEIAFRSIAGAA